MNWDRILAETRVKPHEHNGQPCYRMDCNETELEMTEHLIAKGENVTTLTYVDTEVAYGGDNGAIVGIPEFTDAIFVGHSHEDYFTISVPELGRFVDVEFTVRLSEIEHDHDQCIESLENIRSGDSWKWYRDSVYVA